MTLKIVTVVGARPQFIKAATVSRAIRTNHEGEIDEILLHTGQHYDENMSQVFFDELDIPRPRFNLEISRGGHGAMTGRMLEAIEKVLLSEKPDWVLIYGDTNSTLAGALAAAKLHIPVAHVEAGLRSFNMRMPEEINRVLADRVSSLLFCPTETAVVNLGREGIEEGVHKVGDVMYDASLFYRRIAVEKSRVLQRLSLESDAYALVTCHRAENTDDPLRLSGITEGLRAVANEMRVVFPLHPRTRKALEANGLMKDLEHESISLIEPVPFLDMVRLEEAASVIVTDSGGVQKEAYFFGVPCITMRDETEWVETVECGRNRLVRPEVGDILSAVKMAREGQGAEAGDRGTPYGDGKAAHAVVEHLLNV